MAQFTKVSIKDIARGLDLRSAQNALQTGYSESLINIDTNSNGWLSKRAGYQGYCGNLPFRVQEVQHNDDEIKFILDGSVNTASLRPSPIVVYGKLNEAQPGDWSTTDNVVYYDKFSTEIPDLLPKVPGVFNMPASRHGIQTNDMFINVLEYVTSANNSNKKLYTDSTEINAVSPFDLHFEYTIPADTYAYIFASDKSPVTGQTYTKAIGLPAAQFSITATGSSSIINATAHGLGTGDSVKLASTNTLPTPLVPTTEYYVVSTTLNTFELATTPNGTPIVMVDAGVGTHRVNTVSRTTHITAGEHQLETFNLLAQSFILDQITGTVFRQLEGDQLKIDTLTGDVYARYTNSNSVVFNAKVVMSAGPVAQKLQISSTSTIGTSDTFVIPNITSQFTFVSAYYKQGTDLIQLLPDAIEFDDDLDQLAITITKNTVGTAFYEIYYEFGDLTSSAIIVKDSTSTFTNYINSEPQLTLWGLDHADTYVADENPAGHVTHIDSYRREGEQRIVVGLGGNLFAARNYAEASAEYLMGSTEVFLHERIQALTESIIGPAFQLTGTSSGRTRGSIEADNVVDNQASVVAAEYESPGVVKLTLDLVNKTGSLDTAIAGRDATPLADWITLSNMAHAQHNGSFMIKATDDANNYIYIYNAAIQDGCFDEQGSLGLGLITTDQIDLQQNSEFIPGDIVASASLNNTTPLTVKASVDDKIVVDGATFDITLPGGIILFGTRKSNIFPLEQALNFVAGDMCDVVGLRHQVRVLDVNPRADVTLATIVSDGSTATITTATPHNLSKGKYALLLRTTEPELDGARLVIGTPDDYTFTIASSAVVSLAGVGVHRGRTITLDETLTMVDRSVSPTSMTVTGRWIPFEAPTTNDTLPKSTYYRHLDDEFYHQQNLVRSTMVSDTLFLTNYGDEIHKIDGSSIYRAGLFKWQPQLFAQVDTTTPSITENPRITYLTREKPGTTTVVYTMDSTGDLIVGDRIVDESLNQIFTITAVTETTITVADPDNLVIPTTYTISPTDFTNNGGILEVSQTAHGYVDGSIVRFTTNGTLPGSKFTITPHDNNRLVTADAGTDVLTTTDGFVAISHNFTDGTKLEFTTTGTLPAPLSPLTTYYVYNATPTTFQLATDPTNLSGTVVDLTDTGTGTHTADYLAAADVLVATSHGLQTGDIIQLKNVGGTLFAANKNATYNLPGPTPVPVTIAYDVDYYVIRVSANEFQLALSATDAVARLPINITASGTGSIDVYYTNLQANHDYYVVNATANTFQVSDSVGGNPITYGTAASGNAEVTQTLTTNNTVRLVRRFNYYFRLNAIDSNRNIIASAATGASDFFVELVDSGEIHLRLLGLPTFGIMDYDTLELQVFRRSALDEPFKLARTLDIGFNPGDGYIDLEDGADDSDLVEFDTVNTALLGAEIGINWTQPPRAKYLTSVGNRLLLGNIKDYPELDIVLRKTAGAALDVTELVGQQLKFRRDSVDVGTVTDMNQRAFYEFVNTGAVAITGLEATDSNTKLEFTAASGLSLAVGDWIYAFHAVPGINNKLTGAGWWQISDVDNLNFKYKAWHTTPAGTTTITGSVDSIVRATDAKDIPVWLGIDGNYNQYGANELDEITLVLRTCNAINASMRQAVTDPEFTPWMIAQAGSELGVGRLIVRQEVLEHKTLLFTVPAEPSNGKWFVRSIYRTPGTSVAASTRLFPSRVVVSYPNFPEIFDNPYGDASQNATTIDVNSADGQEITGLIPFFGESVFGGSQNESIVVVFKTNSIYLLDPQSGQVSRLQSRGLGCTIPYSIAPTKEGIIFANDAGIYRLNRDQTISYVGKLIERLWQDKANRNDLSKATGHHYALDNKYKLSLPIGSGQRDNNEVYVYDYQREGRDQEFGAWTTYTNHPVTGWANLGTDAFFASTAGRVFSVRRLNEATDFRDDNQPIAAEIMLMATDFDRPGIRKIVGSIISHFQLRQSGMVGTTLDIGTDLDTTFQSAGGFNFVQDGAKKVVEARSSLPRRRLDYIQLLYKNSTLDENMILTGIDYNVALLTEKGIKESSE